MKYRTWTKPAKVFMVSGIIFFTIILVLANAARGPISDYMLEESLSRQNVSLTEWSLALGANPSLENEYHVSVVARAAGHGDRKMVEVLLVHGANPDVRNYLGQPSMDTIADQRIVKILQKALLIRRRKEGQHPNRY